MRAFGAELSSTQIDDLVALIRSWARTPSAPTAVPSAPEPPPLPAQIVIHPQGSAPRFELRDERFVPADAVKAALDQGKRVVIVDARAHSDYLASHIEGAVNVPFYAVESLLSKIDLRDTWIIAYCACPHAASGHVVDELRARGHRLNAVLDEGIPYWEEKGYPIVRAPAP